MVKKYYIKYLPFKSNIFFQNSSLHAGDSDSDDDDDDMDDEDDDLFEDAEEGDDDESSGEESPKKLKEKIPKPKLTPKKVLTDRERLKRARKASPSQTTIAAIVKNAVKLQADAGNYRA